jgi:outer membrane lipoprotein-sorting protein
MGGVMKGKISILVVMAALLFLTLARAGTNEAEEIIRKVDDLMRGKTQYAKISMTVNNPDWPAPYTFKLESWSKGTDKALMRIMSPAKDSGITFLKIGNEMWQYLPKIDRVMKIPPSMMLGSWMGSDFTNDDLVKESSIVDDYTTRLVEKAKDPVNGEVAVIELMPKPSAAVVWGKLIYRVRMKDLMPLDVDFYDEDGKLVRKLLYEDVKNMDGRATPTVMKIIPQGADKAGRETVLVMSDIVWDKPINDMLFTQRSLKNTR